MNTHLGRRRQPDPNRFRDAIAIIGGAIVILAVVGFGLTLIMPAADGPAPIRCLECGGARRVTYGGVSIICPTCNGGGVQSAR